MENVIIVMAFIVYVGCFGCHQVRNNVEFNFVNVSLVTVLYLASLVLGYYTYPFINAIE